MIFVPGLPTEPGQDIRPVTRLNLGRRFVYCHKTGNTQTAIYGRLVTPLSAALFRHYALPPTPLPPSLNIPRIYADTPIKLVLGLLSASFERWGSRVSQKNKMSWYQTLQLLKYVLHLYTLLKHFISELASFKSLLLDFRL